VRLTVGEVLLFEDMPPHPDSDSPPLPVTISVSEAGYYPFHLLHYEHQRTSTLILNWKPLGALTFERRERQATRPYPTTW
jgi:hypothetical protein